MTTTISEFVAPLRVDFYGCPDTLLDRAVVESIRQFCQDSWFLEKSLVQEIELSDIDSENMNELYVSIGGLLGEDGVFLGVKRLLLDGVPYDVEERNSTEPSKYIVRFGKVFYYKQGTNLSLYPIKSVGELDMKVAMSYREGITEVDDSLFLNWANTIRDYAKMLLYNMPNQPWSDPGRVPWYRNKYRRGVNRAKIFRNRGNSGSDSRVSSRSYVKWLV